MRKSKCKHCISGILLDDNCDKVIGHCWCEIDYYDEDIGCNMNCNGYSVSNAGGEEVK